jgi:hypothetical protein
MSEVPRNPNEALTPIFIGDKLVYVPVIDYYIYREHPSLLLGEKAVEQIVDKPQQKTD